MASCVQLFNKCIKNPKMKFRQSELAKMYKINRSTVNRMVSGGKLFCDADGFIEESDFLVLYRKSPAWSKRRESATLEEQAKITASLPLTSPNQLTGDQRSIPNMASTPTEASGGGDSSVVDLDEVDLTKINMKTLDKAVLDRLKAVEDIREKSRKNDLAESKLISRVQVKRFMGKMGEIDANEWGAFPSRVVDDVLRPAALAEMRVLGARLAVLDRHL